VHPIELSAATKDRSSSPRAKARYFEFTHPMTIELSMSSNATLFTAIYGTMATPIAGSCCPHFSDDLVYESPVKIKGTLMCFEVFCEMLYFHRDGSTMIHGIICTLSPFFLAQCNVSTNVFSCSFQE
jgi:hypothetical protein